MKKTGIIAMSLLLALTFTACSNNSVESALASNLASENAQVNEEIIANEEAKEEVVADETKEQEASEDVAVTEDGKIAVYLSGPEAMITKLEETFEEEHGDVLDMTIMSCGQLRSKVWTESEAGEIQADVIWGSDPIVYNVLDEKEALEPADYINFDGVNADYVWDGKNYAIVSERYVVMIYNNTLLDSEDAPKSFADLTDAAYEDIVVKADASQSATAFAISSALYELEGSSNTYFENLKANGLMLSKSNGLVPSTILEGQYTLGVAPHDSVVRLKNKGKKEGYEVPLEIVWPSEGAIALQRPVAIPTSETRSDEAQATAESFVNFLLGKQAQNIMAKFGFVSVRSDIENTFLPEGVEVYSVDWNAATENEESFKATYDSIFHE